MTTKTTETNGANQGDGAGALDSWAVLELFGHTKVAGKVSEATLAGAGFIRVDVPEIDDDRPAFTRFYGPSAVYAMTPCDERVAHAAAGQLRTNPVTGYVPPGLLLEKSGDESEDNGPPATFDHQYDEWPTDDGVDENDPLGDKYVFLDIKREDAAEWARATLCEHSRARTILALETTGFGTDAEIVRIGVIALDGEVLLDTLVQPKRSISAEATRIHGIDNEAVADAPTFPEIADKLFDVWDCAVVIAYNVDYDRRILKQVCARHGIDMPEKAWECAMTRYAQFYGDWNDHHGLFRWQKLTDACWQQGIEAEGAHSAIGDCRLTLALIEKMAAEVGEDGG